jgi:hypothetical protein
LKTAVLAACSEEMILMSCIVTCGGVQGGVLVLSRDPASEEVGSAIGVLGVDIWVRAGAGEDLVAQATPSVGETTARMGLLLVGEVL